MGKNVADTHVAIDLQCQLFVWRHYDKGSSHALLSSYEQKFSICNYLLLVCLALQNVVTA
jgi:hypothetical protein